MDLKLKNIRHATLMSDETNAFTATQEVSPLRCPRQHQMLLDG